MRLFQTIVVPELLHWLMGWSESEHAGEIARDLWEACLYLEVTPVDDPT